jgi:hypothetical protein
MNIKLTNARSNESAERKIQNEMEATENWSPIALRLVFHIPIPARLSGWGN